MPQPTDFLLVSYSSLNTASTCWRKFEFDKLYPKLPRTFDDSYAAEVGKSLHAGYQDFLIGGDRDSATWAMMQSFPYQLEFTQDNDFRSFEASLSTLESMFENSSMQEYDLAMIRRPNTVAELAAGMTDGLTVPAIEVPFEIRFNNIVLPDGRGVAFIGYIDAILRHKYTKAFRTMDIKTHRQNYKDATGKYLFDSQQVPYGLVVDHVAEGQVDSFEVLYLDAYVDLIEPRVTFYPFKKSRQDIEEWLMNRVMQLQDLQRFMTIDYFPRTDNGCMFWNKPCRYLEPCMSRNRKDLELWFTLGSTDLAKQEEFQPWIVAEIDVGVEG